MSRYQLMSYRYTLFLPSGTLVTRIRCPMCGDLHFDIWEGEDRLCYGCGKVLQVDGLELEVKMSFEPEVEDEIDEKVDEEPDDPSFWFDLLN